MRQSTVLIASILLVSATIAHGQQPDAKETAALLAKGFGQLSGWVITAADTVPADKYSYKPVATVRTFGELVGHIADGYNYFCPRSAGKNVQWSDAIANGKADKTTLVARLKEATDACTAVYGSGHTGMLIQNDGHTNLHYGNIVTYMRMLGFVPPSS